MKRTAMPMLLAAGALLLASPALRAAQPITVTNPGFENPVQVDGSYSTSATGWTNVNTADEIGVWNPDTAGFTAEAPEGANVGYVYGGVVDAGLTQVLTATLQADASYTLTVRVGNSVAFAYDGYRVQLLAGGTLLAEDNNTLSPAMDSFVTATVSYTYTAAEAGLVGQPLEIRLLGKGLSGGTSGETEFDDVQLTVALGNPVAIPGSYGIFVGDSLSLDGSNSLPSEGATITAWEWDIDNDGDFDDATVVSPATIDYATLTGTYGMGLGPNTIRLKVTDSAAKSSTAEGIVQIKSPILVHADWQEPLLNNGTQFTTSFAGWTFNGGAYSRRRDKQSDFPADSSAAPNPNQAVELNGDGTIGETNIAHNWAATDVYHLRIEASPNSWAGTNQRWIRPELRQQNGTLLWQAPQDATTAIPLYGSYMNALTDYPSELTFFFTIDASTFTAGAAGQPLRLRLDSSGQRSVYINKVTLLLGPLPADTTPPTPVPLTWDILPTVSNFTTISMRIGSARDPGDLYDVEYYFENITNGTNSGWQHSREWAQTGLDFDTTYTYRVKARDKSPNQNEGTTWSAEQSATTLPEDLTPPSPDPLTWETAPVVADYRSITMGVNAATDISGVEYYFENLTKGTNSGWIAARAWTEKDLAPNTTYTYRARARDKSLALNVSTTWSTEESATTPAEPAGTLYITRFQDPLIPTNTGNPNLGKWVFGGGDPNSIRMRWAPGDGVRTDTDLATTNQAIQIEWAERWMEYDIPHNWSSTDVFTLTLNASPQQWNGDQQRYIRPSLRQQNGTVLWAPGENLSGPERTALPLYSTLAGPSYQADAGLTFSYTIPASAFSAGTAGQPIRVRIGQSGFRGLYIDNVHLSVNTGGGPTGYAAWATGGEPFAGDANGDGVQDGLAFLLGAATPATNATDLLPTVSQGGGNLILEFDCLATADRGESVLNLQYDGDLVAPWTSVPVPGAVGSTTVGNVSFVATAKGSLIHIVATVNDATEAASGRIFGRLKATE